MLKKILVVGIVLASTSAYAGIFGGTNLVGPGFDSLFDPAPLVKQPIKVPAPKPIKK